VNEKPTKEQLYALFKLDTGRNATNRLGVETIMYELWWKNSKTTREWR